MSSETLPPNWSWVKLGDVIGKDGVFVDGDWIESKDQDPNGEVRLIQLADIGEIEFRNKSDRYLTHTKALELKCTFIKNGDLLVARMPDPLGRTCIFPLRGDDKYVTVVDVAIIRIEKKIVDNKFLCFIINAPQSRNKISELQSGSTRKRISRKHLSTIEFPLPPLPEQKKIVEKIEELFSGLDSGVASLKKAKELVRLYRQSVLASAFSGKLTSDKTPKVDGGINNKQLIIKNEKAKNNSSLFILNSSLPTGWKWVKLGEVCIKIGDVDHKMPKPVENGKYPYLSTKDFTDDLKIDFKKAKLISEEDFNLLSKKIKPQKGDIIFPRYGTIGKNVLVDCDKEFLVSYSCAVIKPNTEKIVTKYLYHYSLSPLIQKEIKKYTVQTTQANVGIESIKNFVVPLPSIIQQAKIVEEIESRFAGSEALEKTIDENLAKSETLRQSILKKAFEGHLI